MSIRLGVGAIVILVITTESAAAGDSHLRPGLGRGMRGAAQRTVITPPPGVADQPSMLRGTPPHGRPEKLPRPDRRLGVLPGWYPVAPEPMVIYVPEDQGAVWREPVRVEEPPVIQPPAEPKILLPPAPTNSKPGEHTVIIQRGSAIEVQSFPRSR